MTIAAASRGSVTAASPSDLFELKRRVLRLETLYDARYAILVALEVNDAIALLVTTALVTDRDAAVVVTATLRHLLVEQRSVRLALVQFVGLDLNDETASRGCRLCFMQ